MLILTLNTVPLSRASNTFASISNANAPPVNQNDEITLYQIGRYISSNEAAWRIFGFPIHERDPAVIQLAVHLENSQRVFFTNETAINLAKNPPKTTLTAFFELCNRADDYRAFAGKLLYSEVPRYFSWECMLAETALNCTAKQIRLLFAIVLTTCSPSRAEILWDNHKDSMTDDILHQHRTRCNDVTITFRDAM